MAVYIVTMVALILAGVFAILVKVWTGFMYFVLALLMVLALFWAVVQIYRYFTSFKKRAEERFKLYKAEVINQNNLSSSNFEANEKAYQKAFQKTFLKDKVLHWCLILFCFALAGAFLVAMILL